MSTYGGWLTDGQADLLLGPDPTFRRLHPGFSLGGGFVAPLTLLESIDTSSLTANEQGQRDELISRLENSDRIESRNQIIWFVPLVVDNAGALSLASKGSRWLPRAALAAARAVGHPELWAKLWFPRHVADPWRVFAEIKRGNPNWWTNA